MTEPLPPYRRGLRPALQNSFGTYMDQELDKISRTLDAQRTAILAGGGGPGSNPGPLPGNLAPAKTWRIVLPVDVVPHSTSYIAFGEIKFQNSAGSTLSVGGTAYAHDYYDNNWTPAEAFDGIDGTGAHQGWLVSASKAALGWIAYHRSTPIAPTKVTVFPAAQQLGALPKTFGVQFSNDAGLSWNTVGVYTTSPPVAGVGQTFNLT